MNKLNCCCFFVVVVLCCHDTNIISVVCCLGLRMMMDLINETSARLRLKPNEQKKSHDLPKTNTIQDIETCYLIYSIKNVALDDVEITIFCGQRKNKKRQQRRLHPMEQIANQSSALKELVTHIFWLMLFQALS